MTSLQSTKKKLAIEIAKEFKEAEKVALYEALLDRYEETTIRQAFEDTKKVPLEKIKKSKSALFMFLLRKYA